MNELPLIPAPRSFRPSGLTVEPGSLTLTEAVVPALGFTPQHNPNAAYELDFGPQGATLRALSPAGIGYGRTSWQALVAAGSVPGGRIED